MEQKKDVIFIPFWIAGMLERNGLPLSVVLNYRKIRKFLSAQEQSNMLRFQYFNPFIENFKGGVCRPSFDTGSTTHATDITDRYVGYPLADMWRKSVSNSTDANDSALSAQIGNLSALSWSTTTEQEIEMRFDKANAPRLNHNHPFITYDIEREVMFVVVYPAFFEIANFAENVFCLCKAVLKVFYVYNTPSAGCILPYFRKYLEKLA